MSTESETAYNPVTELRKALESQTLPRIRLPINPTVGEPLVGITPVGIREDLTSQTFFLDFLRNGQEENIDMRNIKGVAIEVGQEADGEYAGQLLLRFSYLLPNKNEYDVRRGRPLGIFYGVHPNHAKYGEYGEREDFYIVTEDAKYASNPNREERVRDFPLWRIKDVYGDPEELKPEFMKTGS